MDLVNLRYKDSRNIELRHSQSISLGKHISFFSNGIAKKGIFGLIDQGVFSLTNFFTAIIIGRVCSKEELGLYSLGLTIVLFIMGLQDSLIVAPYTVYSARLNGEKHTRYKGSTLIHQAGFSGLAIIGLTFVLLAIHFGVGPKGLPTVVNSLILVIFFILFREYARRICFASLHVTKAFKIDLFVFVIQIGGLILMAHLGILAASGVFIMSGIACGAAGIFWFIKFRKEFILSLNQSLMDIKKNWSFGKWLVVTSLIYALSVQIYPWLLSSLRSPAAVGVLMACHGISFLLNPFRLSLQNIFGPLCAQTFAKSGPQALIKLVIKGVLVIAIPMALFCLILFVFGENLIVFLYGEKYGGAGVIVSILGVNFFAETITLPFDLGLMAIERPDVVFKTNLIALGITILFGPILVWQMGILGVAICLVIRAIVPGLIRSALFLNYANQIPKAE